MWHGVTFNGRIKMKLVDYFCENCGQVFVDVDEKEHPEGFECPDCDVPCMKQMGGARLTHSSAALWKVPLNQS